MGFLCILAARIGDDGRHAAENTAGWVAVAFVNTIDAAHHRTACSSPQKISFPVTSQIERGMFSRSERNRSR